MKSFIILILLYIFSFKNLFSQASSIQIITTGTNTSIRGMSIADAKNIWVSGSNGTIGKSIDGGNTWRWIIVPEFEKRDFRDIEGFDSSTALAMVVDNPAYILKTSDGGATWKKTFEKDQNGMFLDAMDFKNNKEGICIGDPITIGNTGRKFFYVIRTFDGGDSWTEVAPYDLPRAEKDEAIFSASGTNISFLNDPDFEYAFVTGGAVSNLYMMGRKGKASKAIPLQILQGKESAGTFSMATDKLKKLFCIGGDYKVPRDYFDNFFYSTDGGKRWGSPSIGPPLGYRSCIRIIEGNTAIACGPTGVDYAKDAGKEWQGISKEGFNVCMVSQQTKTILFAGEKGKIGKMNY